MDLKKEEHVEHDRFIRQVEVTRLTTIPKSSIPVEIEKGNFPRNATIMSRSRVWLLSEIHEWMRDRLNERDQEDKRPEGLNEYNNKEERKNESNT